MAYCLRSQSETKFLPKNNEEPKTDSLPKKVKIDFSSCKWNLQPPKKKRTKSNSSKKRKKVFDNPRKSYESTSKKSRTSTLDSVLNINKSSKYLSPSAKLDRNVPKAADILRAREEAKKLSELDELIKECSSKFLKDLKDNTIEQEEEKPEIQDINCKHLSLYQLEKKFRRDVKYLDDIFYGKIYSERHEIFQQEYMYKSKLSEKNVEKDLRISESLGAFTNDQLVFIVSLFRERYDNGNRYKNSDYYFKVLLPEYCLKIFMDCHKMTQKKAITHLKSLPMTDYLGLFS